MSDVPKTAASSSSGTTTAPTHLDCSRASTGVWLVKVPNYLAKKWNEAQENSEVGVIRITQSKQAPRPKQEVVFLLKESLSRGTTNGVEEKVPLEHKFVMTPLGNQDVYILKQSEENSKEVLQVIGKVMQRAECTPVQNDSNYLQLKRETMKRFLEPKKQIQLASDIAQKQHFLPRQAAHIQQTEKKDKIKRLRKDKEKVLDILFNAFNKHQYYSIKDLVKITQQPNAYLKDILHEICKYNVKGVHKSTWELKEEFKQGGATFDMKKKAVCETLEKKAAAAPSKEEVDDEFIDDDDDLSDDDDMDDFEEDDS